MKDKTSYRSSHSSDGYGERYSNTYKKGYYFYQWEFIEKNLIKKIFNNLKLSNAKSYLDFACGTGRILKIGEDIFENSNGVDVSKTMISEAKKVIRKSNIIIKDITIEPINMRFDVISSFRFFLNAEPELRSEVLKNFHMMLNDSGSLVLNIHTSSTSLLGMVYNLRNNLGGVHAPIISYEDFVSLLKKHDFKVVQTTWYGYLPRTGWWFDWIPRNFTVFFDKLGSLGFLPKKFAQSFIVVCEKI